ncbi:hypothetical protein CMQ_7750 [Grosmannia clavigera kw1407]|uniref:RRM domain-containing protein n=1 Tax=Grosmannia clavigera (strain kw1407 / UAMH 11150) TaxID=655863 RepID=F0XPA7_GROCL|nr:uncharacterized protein CMQ_7750 [Grosmannia clavigera kw1407]EFX00748.1 hypothetical protein CMQ_7750 [Grosmannia clavigera kw1407]
MNMDQGFQVPSSTATTPKQTGLDRILENPSSSLEHSSLLPRRFGNAVPTTADIKTSENMHVGQPLRPSLFPETTRPGIQPFGLTGSYSWNDGGESPEQLVYRLQQGFSPNYYGNIFAERNKSANVPDHENCSVFLTGLPIGTTVRCLLENICNFGRVYSTHINPPDVATGHLHSAAKIVFFDAFSTQKFIHHCGTEGMQIRGHVVRAVHNRVKSYAARESRMASRVLLIYGPVEIVNPQSLNDFFSRFFKYEVDCIISHGASRHTPDCVLVEYRFASYRCQAQSAKKWLRSSFPGSVDVFYGEDPCALPPSRIANERFLWDMFWGTKTTTRAIMMDMAEQQAVAAATARMTSGVRPSNRWTPPNDRQCVFE